MHKTILTDDEEQILIKYHHVSPIELTRSKAHAILLHSKGYSIKELTLILFRDERSLQRWIGDFLERRLSSLFSGHVNNENAGKLTRDQKEQIKEILCKPPSDYDLPKEFWDVPQLRQYVNAEFGIEYESDQSYHFLMKFSGLSFKYPDRQSPRWDEELVDHRMEAIRSEITPLLSDPRWLIFAADETRVQLESEIRRAWLIKGKRTVVKTERNSEYQNYLGFLNQSNGKCDLFEISRGNENETIRVLRELLNKYPDKQLCVVWDNASWHRSKKLRGLLGRGNEFERIHLVAFPPYAPENNPIEHVWQYAKQQVSNRSQKTLVEIKEEFTSVIRNKIFNYSI